MEIIMYRNLICSSFMAYHRFSNNSNTTGATRGASTTYPSRAHGFTPVWFALFDLWFYAWYFVHHLCFLLSFFFWPLCCLVSDSPFGIFKLYFLTAALMNYSLLSVVAVGQFQGKIVRLYIFLFPLGTYICARCPILLISFSVWLHDCFLCKLVFIHELF